MPPLEKRTSIAILGAGGLLGADLAEFLSGQCDVRAITRENYSEAKGERFDVLINANGNSKRFWANAHPAEDFELSTLSVMKSLFDFRFGKYVYISSPDTYEDPSSPATTREDAPCDTQKLSAYGFHKRLSEKLVRHYAPDFIILRPASILGSGLKKGVVRDILDGTELFVTADSRIQFITTGALAEIIAILLRKNVSGEAFNAGGVGAVTPRRAAELAGRPLRIRADAAAQNYETDTAKIRTIYGDLKTSEEYVEAFVKARRLI